jgi:hypothetical protein
VLNSEPWGRPRFRFDDYWRTLPGFQEAVHAAWNAHVQATDPCRILDQKFRAVAKALKRWRETKVGNIRLQLAAANVDKCVITPIRCSEEQVQAVREVFLCRVQEFPTTYLGAPLSISRMHRSEEQRLVDAVAARVPTWKGGLLTDAGKASLVRTTLSTIPVHISICCCLSTWAIEEIDKRRRAFLWSGSESVAGGRCKIAWPIVCAPKEHGGLGIPDLRILGYALRLRW